MYKIRFTKDKISVKDPAGLEDDYRVVSISIAKGFMLFYIKCNKYINQQIYGNDKDIVKSGSQKMAVKFSDKKNTITIKKSFEKPIKIFFYDTKDYMKIKDKVNIYKLMREDGKSIRRFI